MRQQLTLLLSQDDGLEEIDSHALRLGHFGFYVDCDKLIDFCLRAKLGSKGRSGDVLLNRLLNLHGRKTPSWKL